MCFYSHKVYYLHILIFAIFSVFARVGVYVRVCVCVCVCERERERETSECRLNKNKGSICDICL